MTNLALPLALKTRPVTDEVLVRVPFAPGLVSRFRLEVKSALHAPSPMWGNLLTMVPHGLVGILFPLDFPRPPP